MFVIRMFLCQMIKDVFSDCNKIEVFFKMIWCSLLSHIFSTTATNIHLNHVPVQIIFLKLMVSPS